MLNDFDYLSKKGKQEGYAVLSRGLQRIVGESVEVHKNLQKAFLSQSD
jgi:hypothetical protein